MKTHEIMAIVMLVLVAGWIGFMASNSGARAAISPAGYGYNAQTIASQQVQAASGAYGAQTGGNTGTGASGTAGANTGSSAGQTVTIQVKGAGAQYNPSTIRVTQGQHVRLDFDPSTLPGCEAQVIIWGLNQQITVSPSNHVLEFTADKAGTYRMSCGMGMINGVFIVDPAGAANTAGVNAAGANGGSVAAQAAGNGAVQLQGNAIDPTSLPGPTGGSCGGSSGGCGCGGAR